MGKSTISMAIFNCYVSSPEGILSILRVQHIANTVWCHPWLLHGYPYYYIPMVFQRVSSRVALPQFSVDGEGSQGGPKKIPISVCHQDGSWIILAP